MFLIFLAAFDSPMHYSRVIQPPLEWFSRIKQQGHKAEHSPPPSTFRMSGAISPPPIHLHAICRENFTSAF